jgi:hypothetical protein
MHPASVGLENVGLRHFPAPLKQRGIPIWKTNASEGQRCWDLAI